MDFTIPGGNEKGRVLAEATDNTLKYWADRIEGAIASGTARNVARDKALAAAMRAELEYRSQSGAGPEQASERTPARTNVPKVDAIALREKVETLTGSYKDPSHLTKQLAAAADVANLVSPQTTCGLLPEGCVVALSAVLVDKQHETYGVGGGKVALDRTALSKISSAAGVSWDPLLSCRLDDGSHPYYVHWRAVGQVRDFDGTLRTIKGEVEIDLRDGSVLAEAMIAEAKSKGYTEVKELAQARKFIMRSAETKAMNRAIRSGLSVRSSYQPEDLDKPFVVARLMFTGQTSDPELKQMFAAKMADSFLGARNTLYAEPVERPQIAAGHAPPPVDETTYDDYDDIPDGDEVEKEESAKHEGPSLFELEG